MANDCLVTKLKGEVQNDNLPILGVASFNYGREFAPNDVTNFSFQIGAKAGGNPIHVTSKVPFLPYGTSNKIYTYTINPGYNLFGTIYLADSDLLSGKVSDIVKIDNMYDATLFYLSNGMDVSTPRNNFASINKYAPLEIVSINFNDNTEIADSVYYLLINSIPTYTPGMTNVDKFLELDNLEVLRTNVGGGFKIEENHNDNTVLKYIFGPAAGSLLDLPRNIEYVGVVGATGEITDWVAQMREQGRTSGFVTLTGCNYGYVTYNGTSLKTLFDNNTIHDFGTYVGILVWDADSISWATTVPEGAVIESIPPSVYYLQKHQS